MIRLVHIAVIFLLANYFGAAWCQPQGTSTRPLELLVSFYDIQDLVADSSMVKLEWRVYQKPPGKNSFVPYDYPLSFSLTIEDTVSGTRVIDTRLAQNSYGFTNVKQGVGYRCEIRIDTPNNDSIRDVTTNQNHADSKEYNVARFKLDVEKEEQISWFKPIKEKLGKEFHDFLHYGGTISYILAGMFVVGVILGLYHSLRIFFRTCKWTLCKYLRTKPLINRIMRFDSFEEGQTRLGNKADEKKVQYEWLLKEQDFGQKNLDKFEEKDSHKMARLEKALKDEVQVEISRLTGRTGSSVIDFFISIEHFWNFGVMAPLLGLLGTVTGISKAFGGVNMLTRFSSLMETNKVLVMLSSGINEALYTTIGGLIVGVAFMIFYYLLSWRIEAIGRALETACDNIIRRIENDILKGQQRSETQHANAIS
jgi:biopolymer transport protein ExbB/TolQ